MIAALLLFSWSLLVSVSASADTAEPSSGARPLDAGANVVSLELGTCEASVARDALLTQLRIELSSLGFALTMLEEPHALAVSLTIADCERTPEAIEIAVRSEGNALTSSANMADTRVEDRPRALALSVAELIRHSLPTDSARTSPARAADADAKDAMQGAVEASVERASEPPPVRSHRVVARTAYDDLRSERARFTPAAKPTTLILRSSGAVRRLANKAQWLSGASIQAGIAALPYLEVALAFEALAGRHNTTLGRYRVMTLLSETSLDLVGGQRLALRTGPRFLLGQALARGISDQSGVISRTTRDLSVGVGWAAGGHFHLSERVSLVARLAAGSFFRGLTIRVLDQPVASTTGTWIEASLGVAFVL